MCCGDCFVRLSATIQLWCICNRNVFFLRPLAILLLRLFYYVDLVAYSIDPLSFLLKRQKVMKAENFAALGRLILGEYALVAEAIMSPQYRSSYLGIVQLLHHKVAEDFPLFLSDADEVEGRKHKAIHEHLWNTLISAAMLRVEQESTIFKGYISSLVGDSKPSYDAVQSLVESRTPSSDMIQKTVIRYIFHALLGVAPSHRQQEILQELFFTGGLSSYVGGAIKPPICCCCLTCIGSGKRQGLIDQAIEYVINSPGLENYQPVADISKEGFANVMLSAAGIAGCIGSSALLTNIYKEVPKDYVLDVTDSHEVMLTVLEAARIRAPVNTFNFEQAEESKTIRVHHGKEITIGKGTLCGASIALASHDPKVFGDPWTFNPKRENLEAALINFNHVGFSTSGSGTRQCPGRNLVVTMASDLLIALNISK